MIIFRFACAIGLLLLGANGFSLHHLCQKRIRKVPHTTTSDHFSTFDINKDGRLSVAELIKGIPIEVMQEGKLFLQSRKLFTHSSLKFRTVVSTLAYDISKLINISDIIFIIFLINIYKPLLKLLFQSYNWLYSNICKSNIITIDTEFAYENSIAIIQRLRRKRRAC